MKIYNLNDIEVLYAALDGCESEVILTTEDGRQFNWGTDKDTFRSGSLRSLQLHQIGIQASAVDCCHVTRCLIGAKKRIA